MNELLQKIQESGLSPKHSEDVLSIVVEWVNENYPVAGAVTNTWLRQQGGLKRTAITSRLNRNVKRISPPARLISA